MTRVGVGCYLIHRCILAECKASCLSGFCASCLSCYCGILQITADHVFLVTAECVLHPAAFAQRGSAALLSGKQGICYAGILEHDADHICIFEILTKMVPLFFAPILKEKLRLLLHSGPACCFSYTVCVLG